MLPKEKKDEEAAGGAPQADTQDATAGEGSQDMAAVSAENTGNGGAATTDNPKNEDAGAQNDMPQNAAESANQTGNNQPAGSSDSAPRQTLPLRMAVAILEGRTWAILL